MEQPENVMNESVYRQQVAKAAKVPQFRSDYNGRMVPVLDAELIPAQLSDLICLLRLFS
jgi:hypothetical protein